MSFHHSPCLVFLSDRFQASTGPAVLLSLVLYTRVAQERLDKASVYYNCYYGMLLPRIPWLVNKVQFWTHVQWCNGNKRVSFAIIVKRGEWLWNPTNFFVVCFCSLFWPWPCMKYNSCLLRTEELTNSNVLVTYFMHSVWAQNKRLCTVVDLST